MGFLMSGIVNKVFPSIFFLFTFVDFFMKWIKDVKTHVVLKLSSMYLVFSLVENLVIYG